MSAQPLVAPKQTAGGAAYRDYLSYRLEWVSKLVREEANKIYRKRFGIDIRQLRVLRIAVEQPGRTVSEIVDIAMFERTFVSRLITSLASKGLVKRRICDDDARQFRIDATAKGQQLAAAADRLGGRLNEDLLCTLSPIERKVLDRCLHKLMGWHLQASARDE